MMNNHPKRPARAFTLIELLVVIAIIGVLAALTVPVMSKAYGVAAETQCLSNVRSLGQAYSSYTVDFKRKFPAGATRSGRPDPAWYVNLVGTRGTTSSPVNVPAGDRLLGRYLDGSVEVAVCPLDRGTTDYSTATVAEYWGASYVMMNNESNRFERRVERNGVWSLEGFGLLDVSSPSSKVVMSDFIQLRNLAAGEQNAWHGEKDGHMRAGMAFVDGHAEVMRLKQEPVDFRRQTTRSRGFIEAMAKSDLYY